MRGRLILLGFVAAAAAAGWLAWAASTPGVRPARASADRDEVKAGRELYVRYCATCHGDAGRGDGASAASFATKPSDLTDGRLMNGLPDEFLSNVILNGGPAEGLSPGMPPLAAYLSRDDTRQVIQYIRSIATPPFRAEMVKPLVSLPHAPRQPILFSHVIHAGSFQIPCQYCHADARRSQYAGLPSVERCLGCHKIIGAQDNPEIAKIHDYAKRGQPIPWVRVFKVPEFTFFPHKPHVRFGLECQTCHGPIERMRVVGADTGPKLSDDLLRLVGFRPRPRALTMGWCVECHREQNATHGSRAPLECVTCHH
ncbi:MAG: cytochrome c3 family protein [Candidatus Rokuibacteriota bacterium]